MNDKQTELGPKHMNRFVEGGIKTLTALGLSISPGLKPEGRFSPNGNQSVETDTANAEIPQFQTVRLNESDLTAVKNFIMAARAIDVTTIPSGTLQMSPDVFSQFISSLPASEFKTKAQRWQNIVKSKRISEATASAAERFAQSEGEFKPEKIEVPITLDGIIEIYADLENNTAVITFKGTQSIIAETANGLHRFNFEDEALDLSSLSVETLSPEIVEPKNISFFKVVNSVADQGGPDGISVLALHDKANKVVAVVNEAGKTIPVSNGGEGSEKFSIDKEPAAPLNTVFISPAERSLLAAQSGLPETTQNFANRYSVIIPNPDGTTFRVEPAINNADLSREMTKFANDQISKIRSNEKLHADAKKLGLDLSTLTPFLVYSVNTDEKTGVIRFNMVIEGVKLSQTNGRVDNNPDNGHVSLITAASGNKLAYTLPTSPLERAGVIIVDENIQRMLEKEESTQIGQSLAVSITPDTKNGRDNIVRTVDEKGGRFLPDSNRDKDLFEQDLQPPVATPGQAIGRDASYKIDGKRAENLNKPPIAMRNEQLKDLTNGSEAFIDGKSIQIGSNIVNVKSFNPERLKKMLDSLGIKINKDIRIEIRDAANIKNEKTPTAIGFPVMYNGLTDFLVARPILGENGNQDVYRIYISKHFVSKYQGLIEKDGGGEIGNLGNLLDGYLLVALSNEQDLYKIYSKVIQTDPTEKTPHDKFYPQILEIG